MGKKLHELDLVGFRILLTTFISRRPSNAPLPQRPFLDFFSLLCSPCSRGFPYVTNSTVTSIPRSARAKMADGFALSKQNSPIHLVAFGASLSQKHTDYLRLKFTILPCKNLRCKHLFSVSL